MTDFSDLPAREAVRLTTRRYTEPVHTTMGPGEAAEARDVLDAAEPRGGVGDPAQPRNPAESEAYREINAGWSLAKLAARPPLEGALDLAPAAWGAVQAAADLATETAEAARPRAVEASWKARRTAVIASARTTGKPVTKLPALDVDQANAEVAAATALDALRQARRAYQGEVDSLGIDPAVEAARLVTEAGAQVSKAVAQVAAAQQRMNAAMELIRSVDTSSLEMTALPSGAYGGSLIDAREVGAWAAIDWDSVIVPALEVFGRSERQAIANQQHRVPNGGWLNDYIHLARVELSEGYAHTAHTRNAGIPHRLLRDAA